MALLVPLCMGLHESTWSGGSLAVGEWIGSNDVKTGLVSPLACISFSIAGEEKKSKSSKEFFPYKPSTPLNASTILEV